MPDEVLDGRLGDLEEDVAVGDRDRAEAGDVVAVDEVELEQDAVILDRRIGRERGVGKGGDVGSARSARGRAAWGSPFENWRAFHRRSSRRVRRARGGVAGDNRMEGADVYGEAGDYEANPSAASIARRAAMSSARTPRSRRRGRRSRPPARARTGPLRATRDAGSAVTVQPRAAQGHPLAKPVAGLGEVSMPGRGADDEPSGS